MAGGVSWADESGATIRLDAACRLAGGFSGKGRETSQQTVLLRSCELYDPADGTWSPTGDLAVGRCYHKAALLPNGKVLVVSGAAEGAESPRTATCEIYDPDSGTWSLTDSVDAARIDYALSSLANGNVLMIGGDNQGGGPGMTSCELYDWASGIWSPTGSLASGRYAFCSQLLEDGRVLAMGGGYVPGTLVSGCELYDPDQGHWSAAAAMLIDRYNFDVVRLLDGRVMAAGGSPVGSTPIPECELFDPTTGDWTATGPMSPGVGYLTVQTLLADGRVLATGGSSSSGCPCTYIDNAELYDPATGSWTPLDAMSTARVMHTATRLEDGRVLIVGGYAGTNDAGIILDACELYSP